MQAVANLPLPAVVNDTVVVQHADMRCYASSAAAAAAAGASPDGSSSDAGASPAAVWGQLEQLVAGGDMPSTNWLEGAKQVRRGLAACTLQSCFFSHSNLESSSLQLSPACAWVAGWQRSLQSALSGIHTVLLVLVQVPSVCIVFHTVSPASCGLRACVCLVGLLLPSPTGSRW